MSAPAQIRANALLCDAAQVVVDKLYILGGGWSYMWLNQDDAAFGFMLAADLAIPWDFANRSIPVVARILNDDFEEVTPRNHDGPVRIEGAIVAGRSPQARPGTDLHVPLVIPFQPMLLPMGGYVCELLVDGDSVHRSTFQVARAGQPHA